MDARETRIRAIELKFLVDDAVGARLRDWARQALEPDPHGHGVHGDEYATTSLYFDTPDRAVFHRRRSHGRVKFRVRRYGEGDAVFLERKLRTESVLTKRRTRVSTADLARLCGPGRGAWAGSWFEDRVAARALGPVCQVSYHRTARYLITPGGDVARVTLDADVRALPVADLGFAARPGVPVLPGQMVLEVKMRTHLPAALKRLVEAFGLVPRQLSKYRLGLAAAGAGDVVGRSDALVEAGLHG